MKEKMKNQNIGWTLILLGGFCEVFWVSGLKYADTLPLYALTALGIVFSFTCAILACKSVEVSIAYSVFVGIGTAGIVIAEIIVFKEEASFIKLFLIGLLLFGVIGLKVVSRQGYGDAAEELSKELHLDEVYNEIEKLGGEK